MTVLLTAARVLVALPFLLVAVMRLTDLSATTQQLAAYPLPALFADLTMQFEAATGIKTEMALAVVIHGGVLCAALLMMLNVGARWMALILLVFLLVDNFASAITDPVAAEAVFGVLRGNLLLLAVIGALLAFVALGSRSLAEAGD